MGRDTARGRGGEWRSGEGRGERGGWGVERQWAGYRDDRRASALIGAGGEQREDLIRESRRRLKGNTVVCQSKHGQPWAATRQPWTVIGQLSGSHLGSPGQHTGHRVGAVLFRQAMHSKGPFQDASRPMWRHPTRKRVR